MVITSTNDILSAVMLMERIEPLLSVNTRESISKTVCNTIARNYDIILTKSFNYCKDASLLSPTLESTELLKYLCDNPDFVETDSETKSNLVRLYYDASHELYMFAGKFYTENEFKFSLGITPVLRRIVDHCIDNGYYFGIDKELNLTSVNGG